MFWFIVNCDYIREEIYWASNFNFAILLWLFAVYQCYDALLLRFRTKFHPDECLSRQEDTQKVLKHRCQVFMKLLELGWLSNISVDDEHSDQLIRMLDAGLYYCSYCEIPIRMFCSF